MINAKKQLKKSNGQAKIDGKESRFNKDQRDQINDHTKKLL